MNKNRAENSAKKNHERVESVLSVWKSEKKSRTDVLGSYTGVPSEDNDNVPEQDSDDL